MFEVWARQHNNQQMTPAVRLLKKRGVVHHVVSYQHNPAADSYGSEAATALDLDPAVVFKTLLASVQTGPSTEHLVAIVPVTHQLDLRALASAAKAKRATMTDPAVAERITGYLVGGISPFGQKKQLRTFIDSSVTNHEEINVSGGRRGLEIAIAPSDLIELLNAEVCSLKASVK